MIIFFLIFALFSANPEGAPIEISTIPQCRCNNVDIYLQSYNLTSHFGTRTRNNIIVSCLATILACTWTTIHPNIPAPGESGWDSLKRRVVTWIYALLAPEAITAWAMRQYLSARWIANEYNKDFRENISMSVTSEYKNQWTHSLIASPLKKRSLMENTIKYVREWMHGSPLAEGLEDGEMRPWTITHGFFFMMGGFMRCEMRRPVSSYRYYGDLRRDIKVIKIDAPTITESEIQDRSKGDVLSKTIVILQTTWFIARWSAHLPVTELEVVTLGFAMLNALTYAFWWHKPQSVGVPMFLETKVLPEEKVKLSGENRMGEVKGSREQSKAPDENVGEEKKAPWRTMWVVVKAICSHLRGTHTTTLPKKDVPLKHRSFFVRQLAKNKRINHPRWQLLWRTPYALVLAVLRPLAKLLRFTSTHPYRWNLRVPMFYTTGGDRETVFVISSIIASLFGLVHFIPAWFLEFPSRPEKFLWRFCAGIITGQPIILGAWAKWKKGKIGWSEGLAGSSPSPIINAIVLAGVPLYIVARLTLIVLAILALRDLSERALLFIEWTSFVPHL